MNQVALMCQQAQLVASIKARKDADEINSDEEADEMKKVQRAVAKAMKEAKAENRAKGIGKQALKKEAQDALKLNEKTYEIVCGRYPTSKEARQALMALPKAQFKWITSTSGARGANGWLSKHGTKDMFFSVTAAGKNMPATVYVASESADTSLTLPGSLPIAGALHIMHDEMHCNASLCIVMHCNACCCDAALSNP